MSAENSAVRNRTRRAAPHKQRPPAQIDLGKHHLQPTHRDVGIPACIREDMIQQAAFFRAEKRGFEPGHELDDWLEAEREIDILIREYRLQGQPDGQR